MAPKDEQPVLVAIARLQDKMDALALTQEQHARQIKWLTTAAILVVGALGGPDAVAALSAA